MSERVGAASVRELWRVASTSSKDGEIRGAGTGSRTRESDGKIAGKDVERTRCRGRGSRSVGRLATGFYHIRVFLAAAAAAACEIGDMA